MATVLITGGGVAGLSAGIYLRLLGHNAVICEQHSRAGGNLTGWQRGGYRIDNCIHWLTGTNPASHLNKMWTELGVLGGVPVFQGESLYTTRLNGRTLGLYSDLDRLEREMLTLSPEDAEEILSLTGAIRTVQYLNGVGGAEHNMKYGALKTAAAVPKLVKYYRLTAGELAEKFRHPLIKQFLVSLFTEYFGALGLIFVFADYCAGNAGIPEGGSMPAAKRLTERFTSLGGVLRTGKRAVRANVSGGRIVSVTFADGSETAADYFVFAQDPASVFGSLIDVPMPKRLMELYREEGLMRFSSWHCAFGCDTETLPFSGDLIFRLPDDLREALGASFLVIREYSHVKDASPQGKRLIETMVFCTEETAVRFISLRNDREAYALKKAELAEKTMRAIERDLPALTGKMRLIDMWTPATYARFTLSETGSYMSFAFSKNVLPVPVSGRIDGLKNAFLATQWLRPPGGLPIAAEAGKSAAESIDRIIKRTRRKV